MKWSIPVIVAAIGVFFVIRFQNDSFRKLEAFPSQSYFEDYKPLGGLTFKAEMRVEADLGWKEGSGRLMLFTPDGQSRGLAVFIPPDLSSVFFSKGQSYLVELQVKDGGLIHALSCRRN